MANIARKAQRKKRAYKVWTINDVLPYGENPYLGLLRKATYKTDVIETEHSRLLIEGVIEDLMFKTYAKSYDDTAKKMNVFWSSYKYIPNLNRIETIVMIYLGLRLEENMNLVFLNKKEFLSIESMPLGTEEIARKVLNRAVRGLIAKDVLTKTKKSNWYWFNPEIAFKGKRHKVPNIVP